MKKCLTLILVVLFGLALGICAGVAEDEMTYTCGDYEYVLLPDGTAEITRYTGSDSTVSIPNEFDEYRVTSIGDFAFSYSPSITNIFIPYCVTSIGANPFLQCGALTTINVSPNHPTLTCIDGVLFEKNSKKLICYPCAFDATSYIIPVGTTIIGDSAFYDCDLLSSISVPDSVTCIEARAFFWCYSLTSISISDAVTSIGNAAFAWCESLDNVSIPNSITSISDNAFAMCLSLTNIFIPDSVTSIGNGAFYDCESLTSISVPDSVTAIGEVAFSRCSSLTSISIPDSVTAIGKDAFDDCPNLTLTVGYGSYAETYCKENNLPYQLQESSSDWLLD